MPPSKALSANKYATSDIRAAAACWLRYGKMCRVIAFERGPFMGNPDAVGFLKDWRSIEIEIKVSFSDFKAQFKKRREMMTPDDESYHKRLWGHTWWPNFFYFFVPPELVEKCLPLLRPNWGLITFDETALNPYNHLPFVKIVKGAHQLHDQPIDEKRRLTMLTHQAATVCSLAGENAHLRRHRA